jgi:putative colanic acid biosynthesis UDP-glucose lipid carrier transferase
MTTMKQSTTSAHGALLKTITNSPARLVILMRLADLAAIAGALSCANALVFRLSLLPHERLHALAALACGALALALFPRLGMYGPTAQRTLRSIAVQVAMAWCGIVMAVALAFALAAVPLSGRWVLCWSLAGAAALTAARLAARWALPLARQYGLNTVRVVIVGDAASANELYRRAQLEDKCRYQLQAVCTLPSEPQAALPPGAERLPAASALPGYARCCGIDEIWIALPIGQAAQVRALQHLLRNTLVELRWILDLQGLQLLRSNMEQFLGAPALTLNCPDTSELSKLGKYLFDKLFALAAVLLLSPLLACIWAGIKLSSPGPALFLQARTGLNGQVFKVYKFRTMHWQNAPDGGTVRQACKSDARVTRFGAFLRRTSLDELPQFLNVLRGEMSIVGPRPHAVQHTDLYSDLLPVYMIRHRAKPGITGWAQINGCRGETDTAEKMSKRVQFDVEYIRNWSLWMDLRIVVWTALRGWTGKDVY